MTWSRAWESTTVVTDGDSFVAALNEYMNTYLPTKGYTVYGMPGGDRTEFPSSSAPVQFWVTRTIKHAGNIEITYNNYLRMDSSYFRWYDWSGDQSSITDDPDNIEENSTSIVSTNSSNNTGLRGKWVVYESDQDPDAFMGFGTASQRAFALSLPGQTLFAPSFSTFSTKIYSTYPTMPFHIDLTTYMCGEHAGSGRALYSPFLMYSSSYGGTDETIPYLVQYPTLKGTSGTSSGNHAFGIVPTNDILFYTPARYMGTDSVNSTVSSVQLGSTYYMAMYCGSSSNTALLFDHGTTEPSLLT